jgi:hypothetical protein
MNAARGRPESGGEESDDWAFDVNSDMRWDPWFPGMQKKGKKGYSQGGSGEKQGEGERTESQGRAEHAEGGYIEGQVQVSRARADASPDLHQIPESLRAFLLFDAQSGVPSAGCVSDGRIANTELEWKIFFIGVVFHELSHCIAVKLVGVRIIKASFWGKSSAYVSYERVKGTFNQAFINTAPLLFGAIFSAMFVNTALSLGLSGANAAISIVLAWLGVSIALHAPFSIIDMANIAVAFYQSYRRRASSPDFLSKFAGYAFFYPLFQLSYLLFKIGASNWYLVFFMLQYLFIVLVWAAMGNFIR